jgi:hypothetical protein
MSRRRRRNARYQHDVDWEAHEFQNQLRQTGGVSASIASFDYKVPTFCISKLA